jgi:hypothetical protein
MRHSFAPLLFVASAFALPQASLDGLTACAQTAVLGALAGTGCGLTDVKCICAASGFQAAAQAAITTACGAGDAEGKHYITHVWSYVVHVLTPHCSNHSLGHLLLRWCRLAAPWRQLYLR